MEVIERFGRFQRLAMPGYNCVWSCCLGEQNARRLSLQASACMACSLHWLHWWEEARTGWRRPLSIQAGGQ